MLAVGFSAGSHAALWKLKNRDLLLRLVMLGDSNVERPWLYDKSYEFWLSLGTAKTAQPDYTCLNCINEALDFIYAIVPRRLIIATQESGANFYSNYSTSGYEVGLAFIRHIQDNYDYSFLVPIMYASGQTQLIDEINKEIIRSPDSIKSLLNAVKGSETHRQNLKTLIISKKSADVFSPIRIPLKRAQHWRHIEPSQSDYNDPPSFWYTYENAEFILDFGLKFRMQLRTLLSRPSWDRVLCAPLSIIALLGYYTYRAVRLSIRKASNSDQSQKLH